MRLYNIFNTTNDTKLTKVILEIPCKALSGKITFTALEQPMRFLQAVEFLATLTFKLIKLLHHFLESLHKTLTPCQDPNSYGHPGGDNDP